MPEVSVIIPVRNGAAYIRTAVDSALAQKNVEIEVIVVDDGSTDNTWNHLESFGDKIYRVRSNGKGPYRARNLGVSYATGQWIAFLDADDEWLPDKLAKQLALADEHVGLIYTDRLNVGACDHMGARLSDSVPLKEGYVFEALLLGNFITLSSVVIRKQVLEALGGFSEEQVGVMDWDLWLRFAATGRTVKLCNEPLTRYRWHSAAMSLDLDKRCADRLRVVRRALRLPRGKQVSQKLARRAIANAWLTSAWYAAPVMRRKAIGWCLRSAAYCPFDLGVYKQIAKCCLGLT